MDTPAAFLVFEIAPSMPNRSGWEWRGPAPIALTDAAWKNR
jgi:hypothetical protein